MAANSQALVLLALGVGLLAAARADAQQPPATVIVQPAPAPPAPAPAEDPALLPAMPVPGPPPACAPYEDCNGPLLRGDPLLDRPDRPPPGWFAAVDANIVASHIKNHLASPVPIGSATGFVYLPTAELDWAGSPRLELGYRFPAGFGELLLSYRSLVSEGTGMVDRFGLADGIGFLRSRLNVNVIDLDYASREYSLGRCWDMKWQIGVRIADVFFDSRALDDIEEERSSNSLVGAGPHLVLNLRRSLPVTGLALYSRFEGSTVIGRIRQSYEDVVVLADDSLAGGATNPTQVQAVPTLAFQAGLSWAPGRADVHWLQFAGGYEWERWWDLGRVGPANAELTVQGLFLRAEFAF